MSKKRQFHSTSVYSELSSAGHSNAFNASFPNQMFLAKAVGPQCVRPTEMAMPVIKFQIVFLRNSVYMHLSFLCKRLLRRRSFTVA